MIQVELDVDLQNGLMVVPAGLPGYERSVRDEAPHNAGIGSCVLLDIPELQVHFRLHSFFMGELLFGKAHTRTQPAFC
jgi:hypothetical protein